jgi:hypothetical protein
MSFELNSGEGRRESKPSIRWASQRTWAVTIFFAVAQPWFPVVIQAQETNRAQEIAQQGADVVAQPNALTLSSQGKCEYSEDGIHFSKVNRSHLFAQGATIRTRAGGHLDLFFRRTGTTVRLQPRSEIKLETMSIIISEGRPMVHTILDVRQGRILVVVHSAVAGSTLEIRNADGRAVVEGSGIGRYIITADGTHVSAQGSVIPLRVIGENGITIVSAGQEFSRKDGKVSSLSASWLVKDMIELDEVEATAEAGGAQTPPQKQ